MILDDNWDLVEENVFLERIKNKKIILWGDTKNNRLINAIVDSYDYMFDNNSDKAGLQVNGVNCELPRESHGEVILTAISDYGNLIRQWGSLGYDKWFFFVSDNYYREKLEYYLFYWENVNIKTDFINQDIKYLHFFPDQKFFLPVISVLERKFDIHEHAFVIYGLNQANIGDKYRVWDEYKRISYKYGNIIIIDDIYGVKGLLSEKANTDLDYAIRQCDKILFHGEWLTDYIFTYLKQYINYIKLKGIFIPWSGIVGEQVLTQKYIKELLKFCPVINSFRSPAYQKLIDICDVPKHYLLEKGMTYSWYIEKDVNEIENEIPNVLISNSSYKYQNIIESMNRISIYKNEISVYVITSYGDDDYIMDVRKYGKEMFGDKFYEVNSYMSYKEFVEFINSIDVYVDGSTVGGGYNTRLLLHWLGAKIYMNKTSDRVKFEEQGHVVEDVDSIVPSMELTKFIENEYKDVNMIASEKKMGARNVVKGWENLLNLDMSSLEKKRIWT